jgi:hypothetical protein
MRPPAVDRLPCRARRESGSAYIIALLVLVILTIVGLSLAIITQSEMQIGANERVQQRLFYAANSGISTSTARALADNEYSSATYSLPDPGSPLAGATLDVDMSPFYPILDTPCHLCEINNRGGGYSGLNFKMINHAVTATAMRRRGGGAILAQKVITTMVEVQPWQSTTESLEAANHPEELAKIKF